MRGSWGAPVCGAFEQALLGSSGTLSNLPKSRTASGHGMGWRESRPSLDPALWAFMKAFVQPRLGFPTAIGLVYFDFSST